MGQRHIWHRIRSTANNLQNSHVLPAAHLLSHNPDGHRATSSSAAGKMMSVCDQHARSRVGLDISSTELSIRCGIAHSFTVSMQPHRHPSSAHLAASHLLGQPSCRSTAGEKGGSEGSQLLDILLRIRKSYPHNYTIYIPVSISFMHSRTPNSSHIT